MDIPPAFQFSEPEALAFVGAHDFGMLVTGDLSVSHIPLSLQETVGGYKVCGHISIRNSQIDMIRAGAKAKAIFTGRHAYISPMWYSEPYRNVPTWNYQAVEIIGRLKPVADAEAFAALTTQVETYETEWSMGDLSERYVAGNLRAILPFELSVDDIIGKNKMSQNKSPLERNLIADKLEQQGQADVAALMRTHNE